MTDDQPLNREQRRAARYRPNEGQPDPHAVGGGPVAEGAAGQGGDGAEAMARSGGGDVTRRTGPGTGGATESDERLPHHEGSHFGHQPNS